MTPEALREQFIFHLTHELKAPTDTSKMFMMNYAGAQFFKFGQKIIWDQGEGDFVKIGNYGELIVKLKSGEEKALFSEDVHLKP